MNFTLKQLQLIALALDEYEENHYMNEDMKWQEQINALRIKVAREVTK